MHLLPKSARLLAGVGACVCSTQVLADMPKDRPFSMRGVELGITVSAFRAVAIPNDGDRYEMMESQCSDGEDWTSKVTVSEEDKADGITDCKWYSQDKIGSSSYLFEHWIDIGTGKGIPTFRFIEADGEARLFRVSFYANSQYYLGILDALTRGYGPPVTVVEPFKTLGGGDFTSAVSVWNNGLSTIELEQRCGHLERYCLTYDHTAYARIYAARKEKRAAAAALKL